MKDGRSPGPGAQPGKKAGRFHQNSGEVVELKLNSRGECLTPPPEGQSCSFEMLRFFISASGHLEMRNGGCPWNLARWKKSLNFMILRALRLRFWASDRACNGDVGVCIRAHSACNPSDAACNRCGGLCKRSDLGCNVAVGGRKLASSDRYRADTACKGIGTLCNVCIFEVGRAFQPSRFCYLPESRFQRLRLAGSVGWAWRGSWDD